MFKFVAFVASLASVAAFAPSGRLSNAALKMSYENEVGALSPTGFFDPLSKKIKEYIPLLCDK
jgi:hypothetical protein